MGGQPIPVQGTVAPGGTYDFSVELVAPLQAGVYRGIWQMLDAQGTPFGEKVWVTVNVPGAAPPTAAPPSDTIQFSVDRTNITAGQCVTFQWSVQNVSAVYFFQAGQDYTSGGVAGQSSQQVCPPATTTYYLRVEARDGTVQTRQIQVVVNPAENAPVITRFTVDPSAIYAGQCVTVQWAIQGPANLARILRNGDSSVGWRPGSRQPDRLPARLRNDELSAGCGGCGDSQCPGFGQCGDIRDAGADATWTTNANAPIHFGIHCDTRSDSDWPMREYQLECGRQRAANPDLEEWWGRAGRSAV